MNDNAERRYRRLSYRITLDEQDITPRINGILIRLHLRQRAQRGEATFDITLAEGHADILPESPLTAVVSNRTSTPCPGWSRKWWIHSMTTALVRECGVR